LTSAERRELVRAAINLAKRERLERAGGYAAVEREEKRAA
jgi:hypothetical protein